MRATTETGTATTDAEKEAGLARAGARAGEGEREPEEGDEGRATEKHPDTTNNSNNNNAQQLTEPWPNNPIQFITLNWLSRLVMTGTRRPLQFEDMPRLPTHSKSDSLAEVLIPFQRRLQTYLAHPEKDDKPPSCFGDLWRFIRVSWLFSVFLDFLQIGLVSTQPVIMAAILRYLEKGDAEFFISNPVALAIVFFLMGFLTLCLRQAVAQMFRKMHYNLQSIVMTAVYAKSLKLSNKSNVEFSKGRVLQMINMDVAKVSEVVQYAHNMAIVPLQLAFTFYYLAVLFGSSLYPVGIVLGVFFLVIPVLLFLMNKFRANYLKYGDKRLAMLREVLEGMKAIKLRGHETYFDKVLKGIRGEQVGAVKGFYIVMLIL
ncbi:hypothetical protein HDU80_002856, partial [Chytriomyces hyalinus]